MKHEYLFETQRHRGTERREIQWGGRFSGEGFKGSRKVGSRKREGKRVSGRGGGEIVVSEAVSLPIVCR